MDLIPDKLWAMLAAVVSALGGFVLYERNKIDARFVKIEQDISDHKINVAVFKESLLNLKEDTEEIKELLKRKRK